MPKLQSKSKKLVDNETKKEATVPKKKMIKKDKQEKVSDIILPSDPHDKLKIGHIKDMISGSMQQLVQLKFELVLLGLSENSSFAQR